jgi:hypothetical protein
MPVPLASEMDIVLPAPPWWVIACVVAGVCLAFLVFVLLLARKCRP